MRTKLSHSLIISKIKLFCAISAAIIIGLSIPVFFVMMDLAELSLSWSLTNSVDIFKSQRIYTFSAVVSPFVTTLLFILFRNLRTQREYFLRILKSLPSFVIVLDEDNKIHFQNTELFDQTIFKAIDTQFSSNTNIQTIEIKEKTYSVSIVRIGKHNVYNLKDITTIIASEKLITEQRQQLIRSEHLASLGTMAAGISHEINNPLSVIIGNADLLRRSIPRSEIADRIIDRIEKNAYRVSEIVRSMRNLSRTNEKGSQELILIRNIYQDIDEILSLKLKGTSIVFRIIDSKDDVSVMAQRNQISQVLINLLNNAYDEVKTQESPWIELEIKNLSHFVELRIRNSGPKISQEIANKIFNPFFTTKDPGAGTGLGLSICHTIIKSLNGDIFIDHEEHYTTFVVRLNKHENAQIA